MGVSASTAFLTMQGAGAVGQAYGAYSSSLATREAMQSQANIADTQANISDINAQGAEFSAQQTLLAGQRREQNVMLKGAQLKSTQRAGMAANGVDLGSGSAVNVLTSTDVMTAEDTNAVHLDAVRSAWGYRTQATNYANEAIGKRAQANGLRTTANAINPTLAGAASLISGAGQVAASWYMANKLGMFGDGSSLTTGGGLKIGGGEGLRAPSLDGDIGLKMPRVGAGYGLRF